MAEIGSWPGYRTTPLRSAHRLASGLGLASVHVKDESGRFGLGSFKALGGAYGVLGATGGKDGAATVTCASDGNHGRSVAWGARMFGARAVIYLPSHVTEVRARLIRSFGARVVRVGGEYDDAVRQAARDAREQGWTVISDTSYEGYMEIPRTVMAGYTLMVEEALGALAEAPTHVFVQGGVGGLAAAVIGHLWERLGAERPTAVVVEPGAADGLYRSARAGAPRAARGDLHTIMAGLSCREISPLAWEIVGVGAHAFMAVADGGVPPLMRAAATGALGEAFEGGESGVAGLLGLKEAADDAPLREGDRPRARLARPRVQHRGRHRPRALRAHREPGSGQGGPGVSPPRAARRGPGRSRRWAGHRYHSWRGDREDHGRRRERNATS